MQGLRVTYRTLIEFRARQRMDVALEDDEILFVNRLGNARLGAHGLGFGAQTDRAQDGQAE